LNAGGDDAAAVNGDSGATAVQIDLEAFKIVYIAPMKALVQEVNSRQI
jgi:replicative superfamily II helicase